MSRRIVLAAGVFVLVACASRGEPEETVERSRHVGQRMLLPNAKTSSAAAIPAYELRTQERFRMPQPVDAATPQLSAGSSRTMLAPTTVCVRAVVSEQGQVQRVDVLDDRDECHAGVAVENSDLSQAARESVLQWTFAPAAVCTWRSGTQPPAETDDCAGAAQVQPVPVSLLYAFTFEIREGKATVRGDRTARP